MRKRKKKTRCICLVAVFSLAFIIYIAYAIRLPEEASFQNILADVTGSEQVLMKESGGGDTPDAVQEAVQSSNAVDQAFSDFAKIWDKAAGSFCDIAGKPDNLSALGEYAEMLKAAQADLFEYWPDFQVMTQNNNGVWTSSQDGNATVKLDESGCFLFEKSLSEDGDRRMWGRVNAERTAFYTIVKNGGNTQRYWEIMDNGAGGYYIQLLSAQSSFPGVVFFEVHADGRMNCARINSEEYTSIRQFFQKAPSSWEEFSEGVRLLFVLDWDVVTVDGEFCR